jgi:hypothetical protein
MVNRRELLKTALWSMPAILGGGFSLSCGSSSSSGPPNPNPPPCSTSSHALGLSFASSSRLKNIAAAPTATQSGSVILPGYFSLDDVNMLARMGFGPLLPPIGNQGQQGSCVAWGVGYATATAATQLAAAQGPVSVPSSQASPADLYAKLIQYENSSCGNGTLVADALDILVVEGVVNLASSPYSDQQCSIPSSGIQFLLNGYTLLDPTNLALLKQHISNFSVIPIAIPVYPDFESASGSSVYSPSDTGCSLGGHCVAIVGYDDTRQAFRIMNSWSPSWGDNGFLWVAYNAIPSLVQEAYLPTGLFWPSPIQGAGGIVQGSVTSNGSISISAAVVISWSGPDPNSSTPWLAFINIALSGPLQVSSVQMQYADSNPGDTIPLGNFSVQQWSRTLIFQIPLTNAQDQTVFSQVGTVSIAISGVSATGELITTSCQVLPSILR